MGSWYLGVITAIVGLGLEAGGTWAQFAITNSERGTAVHLCSHDFV